MEQSCWTFRSNVNVTVELGRAVLIIKDFSIKATRYFLWVTAVAVCFKHNTVKRAGEVVDTENYRRNKYVAINKCK